MPKSSIEIDAKVNNEKLDSFTEELAKSKLETQKLKAEIKALEKATQGGTKATQEQTDAMVKLQKALIEQERASKDYKKTISDLRKEINDSAKAFSNANGGVMKLAEKLGIGKGFTIAFSSAIGTLAANLATTALAAISDFTVQVINMGAQLQQSVAQLSAMTGSIEVATEAQRVLNDVYRNTNYNEEAVMSMGTQLMRMGYSAQDAAGLIQLCADAAAGLGTGQAGAQQLVDAISRMQAVGELTSKQLTQLKMSGVDMDAVFKSLGMNGEQAMKAVENGTLDTQQAIAALTEYLRQYDGKMAESKNNTIDAWGDVQGNMATVCAEIGKEIFDAFNQSEIVQKLIDFTQSLVDMVRSDASGAFTDLKAIAGEVLNFIGGLLGFVLDAIKLIIVILHDAYAAFKEFGAQVVDAVRPAVDIVLALYDAVKAVMSSIGKNFGAEVGRSWGKTFRPDSDDAGNQKVLGAGGNNFQQHSGGGGRSGGGGCGGAAKALSEEEKQIEALIKKYADAEKQKWSLAKATLELAKVNMSMLVGEEKKSEEKRIKLEALKNAHDQLVEGYNNELAIAAKVQDAGVRDKTIQSIKDQIEAEDQLYKAKVKAIEFESNYQDLQEQSKSILDTVFGDPDDVKAKIAEIKENLVAAMEEVDAAVANPDETEALNGLAKLLNMTPDALAEELELKGQSLQEFAEEYKNDLAKVAEAEASAISTADQWSKKTQEYAKQVGFAMADAMTDFIMGEKSAKQALSDFVKGIIQSAVRIMTQWLALYAIYSAFPWTHAAGLTPADAATRTVFQVNAATGGYISGPGTGTSDSIPAMLSNGEYVIRSAAVDRIGIGTLNALNSGALRFAEGGSVDAEPAGMGGGSSVILNVSTMDAASFTSFLNRGGLDSIKQALFEDNRQFAAEAGVW